ncbi:MAG: hypothetical protein D6719_00525 [Candidatus Dadabacteria bacterium]|nr:MAG: hypothetical protein D6719_00525 [Candidatus Dadabacteria bacterium]
MANNKLAKFTLLAAIFCLATVIIPASSYAVPNFARKTGLACSSCHSSFPRLNAFGREFFRNGYVRTGETEPMFELSETAFLDKNLFGVLAKMRPYDKKDSGDSKIRAFHEIELFIAGSSGGVLGNNLSFFAEIEAEDETDFSLELAPFEAAYHFMPEFSIYFGNRSLADGDPFGTITNHGRVTRSKRVAFNQTFSSGNNPDAKKQGIAVKGTINDAFYYAARIGTDNGDPEGEGEEDFAGRVAYIFPWCDHAFHIGGYYADGKQAVVGAAGGTTDVDFTRWIIDAMYDTDDFTVIFAYQNADDDTVAGGSETNTGWYAEGSYYYRKDGNPLFVPTVRWDQYETNDGNDDYSELTVQLAYYFKENIKAFVEYWNQVDTPDGVDDDSRWTVQIEAGL